MFNRILPRTHRFRCPDEHQLAAYVDQQLIGAERQRVESHVAKCDSCLRQVGFLVKESQAPSDSVPSFLLDRANKLDNEARTTSSFGWKYVAVAAAIALVALGLVIWREARSNTEENSSIVAIVQQPSAVLPHKGSSEAATAVRSVSPSAALPHVLSPQPGAIVHRSDFIIRWESIPKATAYEVRVVTADGDLVWSKRVHENSAKAPDQVLRPGMKYFLWVRAFLANGKEEQSQAVGFVGG